MEGFPVVVGRLIGKGNYYLVVVLKSCSLSHQAQRSPKPATTVSPLYSTQDTTKQFIFT